MDCVLYGLDWTIHLSTYFTRLNLQNSRDAKFDREDGVEDDRPHGGVEGEVGDARLEALAKQEDGGDDGHGDNQAHILLEVLNRRGPHTRKVGPQ